MSAGTVLAAQRTATFDALSPAARNLQDVFAERDESGSQENSDLFSEVRYEVDSVGVMGATADSIIVDSTAPPAAGLLEFTDFTYEGIFQVTNTQICVT